MKIDVMEDFYKLLHPCMTVLIVSISREGKLNVMTCAWNMPVSEDPPLIAVAISNESYTNQLIKETGEFTVNIPDEKMLKALWICGSKSGREVDKFKLAKLTTTSSKKIAPPIINECVAHLECRVWREVEAGECTIFISNVLEAYCNQEVFKKGVWDIEKISLPMHLGGKLFAIPTKIMKPP
ncbi:MAG: flavin reductase family protein [Nitrososphaerota archaeon]|nr:flavin reductase family protein [Candidatus Geocrenenecus dongiae]